MTALTTVLTILGWLSVFLRDGLCNHVACPLHRENQQGVVKCSHVGLTSLPESWPAEVTQVDLSYNRISSLRGLMSLEGREVRHVDVSHNLLQTVDVSTLSQLTSLHSLDLSYNQLTLIHPRSFDGLTSLKSLNLKHNLLGSIMSADTFQGLSGLRWLDLSENQLNVLLNDTFCGLHELTWLGFRANNLQRLEVGALSGLGGLLSLDLAYNSLYMTCSALPAGVFSPLWALRDLRLEHNDMSQEAQYPDQVFNHLPSLRHLVLDTFNDPYFGQDFAALSQLHTLDLSVNCKITRLTNESFHGFKFSSLRVLLIEFCQNLLTIETCAFCHLPNLTVLHITHSHFMNPTIGLKALYGFQGQTMDEIDLSSNGNWGPDSFVIDKQSARFLLNICVSTLRTANCKVRRIKSGSVAVKGSRFSQCIHHVDISGNTLKGDIIELLRVAIFYPHLQTFQVQNQQVFSIEQSVCVLSNSCTDHVVIDIPKTWTLSFTVPLPPALVMLNASAFMDHLTPLPHNLTFSHAENLKALDLSYNGMANCESTLHGLEFLEILDLNFNYCYTLSETLLDNLHNLKHLGLSNFGAPNQFYMTRGVRFFQHLHRLEELDLSLNRLLHLPADMLQEKEGLTHLQLSTNRFQSVPFHLADHHNLTLLDLSHNMLSTLTVSERAALDHLASRHELRLKLNGNPLACTCANLDMVLSLEHTSVLLDGDGAKGNYSCTQETGEMTDTHRVQAAMLPHWRKCVGVQFFGLAVSLFLTQLLLLVITYVIRTQWTRLRYVWKVLRRHQLPDRLQDFARDAYLVYADTDRDVMWACRTLPALLRQHRPLRLLLRNAEELPGVDMAQNIGQHIDMSWKTVLLVTQDFSRDPWACGFAVRQATRCISDLTPGRVLVVFLEDPGLLDPMPSLQVLLPVLSPNHVLHVHPLSPAQHPAWRALADAIVGD